jgi:hypothetical protein
VLSLVGVGTSIGRPLDVPIILRSLAVSLACSDKDELPVSFDYDFLVTLDTDLAEQNTLCRLVKNYECAWWKERKPRTIDLVEILDEASLEKCLDTHIVQTTKPAEIISDPVPTESSTTTSAQEKVPPAAPALPVTQCERCDEYSRILTNTLVDVVNIHAYANMMLTCAETQWSVDMHRASTFHQLHEAVVIKETADPSSATNVNPSAEMELPSASHKWTWGERLTKTEVLEMKGPQKKTQKCHSGYNLDLKDGKRSYDDTPPPSMPETLQDDRGASAIDEQALPDNNVRAILDFEKMRDLIFDPLGKRRPPRSFPHQAPACESADPNRPNLQPRILGNLTKDNLILHDAEDTHSDDWIAAKDHIGPSGTIHVDLDTPGVAIEDIWVYDNPAVVTQLKTTVAKNVEDASMSGSVDRTPAAAIEDLWLSGTPAAAIEDLWLSGSVEGTPPAAIEDLWLSGSVEGTPPAAIEDLWLSGNVDGTPPAAIEDLWLSGNVDGTPAAAIEDLWLSGSGQGHDGTPASRPDVIQPAASIADSPASVVDDISAFNSHAGDIEDELSSVSNDDASNDSPIDHFSQPTVNSRLMVSPSRITIDDHRPSFPLSDNWPVHDLFLQENIPVPNSTLETPAPGPSSRFTPGYFAHLNDEMFADKRSDSESSEEYE